MTDKINEFKKAFDERTKNGLKEGDQPDFSLCCMIGRAEYIFETIGELTEYKSFTSAKVEEDLMAELYSAGTSLLSCFKYFNEDYMKYVAMATEKESGEMTETNTNNYDNPQRYTGEDGKDLIDHMEEGLIPEEQVRGFLRGNALKCLVRYKDKNGTDDLIKANEYIRRLIAFENEGNNR